jgi:hypothetical protein
MSDDKPKKKRFEGLIQFREALRQSLVCLQASLDQRFATALQSKLLHNLNENPDQAFHLLLSSQGAIGQVDELEQITDRHLLIRIYQQQAEDLSSEITLSNSDPAQIRAWLDPTDSMVSSYFFRLASLACNNAIEFDLKHCLAWGSTLKTRPVNSGAEIEAFLSEYGQKFGLSPERSRIMREFVQALSPLLSSLKQIHLMGDGAYVGLLLEGFASEGLGKVLPNFLAQLKNSGAHTLAINIPEDPKQAIQFAMLVPVRPAGKSLRVHPLRGLIILDRVRRRSPAKLKQIAS